MEELNAIIENKILHISTDKNYLNSFKEKKKTTELVHRQLIIDG